MYYIQKITKRISIKTSKEILLLTYVSKLDYICQYNCLHLSVD